MRSIFLFLGALILALPASDGVLAQQPAPPFVQVDPNVADVNSLSTSLRDMQVDLRVPLGFSNVYRVPGQSDKFMRASGGLFAIFPQSQYVSTRQGLSAKVPAGTTYHIGLPTEAVETPIEAVPSNANENRIDQQHHAKQNLAAASPINFRIDALIPEVPSTPEAPPQPPAKTTAPKTAQPTEAAQSACPSLATDENYRARRISELLARAAAAYSQRSAAPVQNKP